jgi:hypothetical protein
MKINDIFEVNNHEDMISVITGDIVNSRKVPTTIWLNHLKPELNHYGPGPEFWEIYGGDTFQFRIDDPLQAFIAALKVKTIIKKVKPLDVRLAIGIGEMNYKSDRITESNGTAFIHSGEKFGQLKKEKQTMAVKSPWPEFDTTINLCLKLGMLLADNWTLKSAEVVNLKLLHPDASQDELGTILGNLKQNAISTRLSRAHYDELMEVNKLFINKLKALL